MSFVSIISLYASVTRGATDLILDWKQKATASNTFFTDAGHLFHGRQHLFSGHPLYLILSIKCTLKITIAKNLLTYKNEEYNNWFWFFLHAVEHRYECAVTKNQILPTLHRNRLFCKECWKKCIGFNTCVLLNLIHSTFFMSGAAHKSG